MKSSHTLKNYSLSYRDANNYEELEQALVEATAESDVFDPNLFDENLYKADSTDAQVSETVISALRVCIFNTKICRFKQ
ncbi:MAG: hypothetical protein MZU84_07720 [Sphingobacterium sp.]|nr:hypothetical protein [Sphingobacterium sp.]